MFTPDQIIFAPTTECNLHCTHCFVRRSGERISIDKALVFLDSCHQGGIERVGFSGGEPFLYLDFLCELSKAAVERGMLFDRIMTNGDFWQEASDLQQSLQAVYDAGFDGKFGLSFDSFHNQEPERIAIFLQTVHEIWNDGEAVEIQSVIAPEDFGKSQGSFLTKLQQLATLLDAAIEDLTDKRSGQGLITIENEFLYVPIMRTPLSFSTSSPTSWQDATWFRDDFCRGPGNILYVHANGKVAPCCGFANENPALLIGTIDNSYQELLENAANNRMVQTCFVEGKGLELLRKKMEAEGHTFPGTGKTADQCLFCEYACQQYTRTKP